MVLGFNHNVMYKGEVFHIQTEDSGVANPHIVTLLYKGGSIIASRKTSYADIIKVDNLERVVEELMKEQHKEMLRRLKSGDYDGRLSLAAPAAEKGSSAAPRPSAPAPLAPIPPSAPPKAEKSPEKPAEPTLEDIIFDFLNAGEK